MMNWTYKSWGTYQEKSPQEAVCAIGAGFDFNQVAGRIDERREERPRHRRSTETVPPKSIAADRPGHPAAVLCSSPRGIALRRVIAILSGSLVVALALAATAAFAAEVSREEYKAAAEPICKRNAQANERILAGVHKEVRAGKLKPAGAKFTKVSRALKKALRELERVPAPTADEARLAKWFSLVEAESELFGTVGRKLKVGDKADAQRTIGKLYSNANKANNEVLPFGFRYCRLEPTKFT